MRQVLKTVYGVRVLGGTAPRCEVRIGSRGRRHLHSRHRDYPGTMSCTGSGAERRVPGRRRVERLLGPPASSKSVANGRPYAVVGFNGGSCAPWAKGGEYGSPTRRVHGDLQQPERPGQRGRHRGPDRPVPQLHGGLRDRARHPLRRLEPAPAKHSSRTTRTAPTSRR